ncbi:hypothetical protein V6N13_106533 [Hibiscus sabdariffa]
MLLKEGYTNLDESYALHYTVAYCDAKTTTEMLNLGLDNVNHRNFGGIQCYTKAIQILKQLTRAVDYYKSTKEGKASPKEQLSIQICEQAKRGDPLYGEASLSLLHLEHIFKFNTFRPWAKLRPKGKLTYNANASVRGGQFWTQRCL